ncbi:MAG TPA: hypothetical protein VFE26_15600 [Trebonia sp.]|nr:hypothetical protein [Trebonia sp.]
MSFVAAYADVVAVLEAAGVRVAQRDGDITPPVVYIGRGTLTDAGAPLAGGRILGAYLYFIPVRGVDNMAGDLETLDVIYDALSPIAWAPLNATWSSVTVKSDTWPCWRIDMSAASVTTAALKG